MAAALGWGVASGCLVSVNDDDEDVYYTSASDPDAGEGGTGWTPGGPTTSGGSTGTVPPGPSTGTSSDTGDGPVPPEICAGSPNVVRDPSFENGQGWEQSSDVFESLFCDASCNDDGDTFANSGSWWVWLGGTTYPDVATVRQTVSFAGDAAVLTFHLAIAADALVAQDTFTVRIDGQSVFSVAGTQADAYANYVPVRVDVRAFADGAVHELEFEANVTGTGNTSFFLDDVSIASCEQDPPADETGGSEGGEAEASTGDAPADTDGAEDTSDTDEAGSTTGGDEGESGDASGEESTSGAAEETSGDTKDHSTNGDTSGN